METRQKYENEEAPRFTATCQRCTHVVVYDVLRIADAEEHALRAHLAICNPHLVYVKVLPLGVLLDHFAVRRVREKKR